jgi:hypothetical protein
MSPSVPQWNEDVLDGICEYWKFADVVSTSTSPSQIFNGPLSSSAFEEATKYLLVCKACKYFHSDRFYRGSPFWHVKCRRVGDHVRWKEHCQTEYHLGAVVAYERTDRNQNGSTQQTLFQAFKVVKATKRSDADATTLSTSPMEQPLRVPASLQKTICFRPSQESHGLSNSAASSMATATYPMPSLLAQAATLSETKCQGLLTLKAMKDPAVQRALFCHSEYYAGLDSVMISKEAGLWSMYSHSCSIDDVNCRNPSRKNVCNACWKIICSQKFNWSKERLRLLVKLQKISDVKILLRPSTNIDLTKRKAAITLFRGFVSTGDKFFSTAGKELRQNVLFRLRYDSTRLHLKSEQSDDDFFSSFKAQFINEKNVQLALSFLELAVGRSNGNCKGRIPEVAMDFLTAVQCNSPAVFRLLSSNIGGPSERHVLR